jgi:hippurate hydrolase
LRLIPEIQSYHAQLIALRRDIHAHPELAYDEHRTAALVAEHLRAWGFDVDTGLARTGVVGSLSNGAGPTVGLRADMDALPIVETNSFPHRSVFAGKMHACGHDGHTAMLLGAARYLAESRDFRGTVRCIFQPAEEAAGGAKVMLEEGLFERLPVDAVFGMHNWPGLAAAALRRGRSWPRSTVSTS